MNVSLIKSKFCSHFIEVYRFLNLRCFDSFISCSTISMSTFQMLRNCWANFAPFSGLGCSWQRVGDDECFVSSFIGIAHLPMSPASSCTTPWWRDPPNLVSERTQTTLHQQSQAFYLADHVSGMGPGMGPGRDPRRNLFGECLRIKVIFMQTKTVPRKYFSTFATSQHLTQQLSAIKSLALGVDVKVSQPRLLWVQSWWREWPFYVGLWPTERTYACLAKLQEAEWVLYRGYT